LLKREQGEDDHWGADIREEPRRLRIRVTYVPPAHLAPQRMRVIPARNGAAVE
jgi:hypothetical protein